MAFRIEYFKGNEIVMAAPCPKPLNEAKELARENLKRFGATRARIRDMDHFGEIVTWIEVK